jgi:hypothetical protein
MNKAEAAKLREEMKLLETRDWNHLDVIAGLQRTIAAAHELLDGMGVSRTYVPKSHKSYGDRDEKEKPLVRRLTEAMLRVPDIERLERAICNNLDSIRVLNEARNEEK